MLPTHTRVWGHPWSLGNLLKEVSKLLLVHWKNTPRGGFTHTPPQVAHISNLSKDDPPHWCPALEFGSLWTHTGKLNGNIWDEIKSKHWVENFICLPRLCFQKRHCGKSWMDQKIACEFYKPKTFLRLLLLGGKKGHVCFFNWLIWKCQLVPFWVKSQVRRSDRQQKWQHPGEGTAGTLYGSLGIELTASYLATARQPVSPCLSDTIFIFH